MINGGDTMKIAKKTKKHIDPETHTFIHIRIS